MKKTKICAVGSADRREQEQQNGRRAVPFQCLSDRWLDGSRPDPLVSTQLNTFILWQENLANAKGHSGLLGSPRIDRYAGTQLVYVSTYIPVHLMLDVNAIRNDFPIFQREDQTGYSVGLS